MLEAVKDMLGLVKQVSDASLKADMQQTIIDVQSDCLALQAQVSDLRSENDSLSSELSKLKARAERRKQMSIVNGCYRINDDLGDRSICGNCYECKGTTILLRNLGDTVGYCDTCKTSFRNAYPR